MRTLLGWRRWLQLPPRRGHGPFLGSVVFGAVLASRLLQQTSHGNTGAGFSALRVGAVAAPTSQRSLAQRQSVAEAVKEAPSAVLSEEDVSLQGQLQAYFGASLTDLVPADSKGIQALVAVADPRFGDYQCNNAMAVFKSQKREKGETPQWKSPRDVGEALRNGLPEASAAMVGEVSVAPQGFVTVKLRQEWIDDGIKRLYENPLQFHSKEKQRVVIDYSSPNIAKEMHVGHLRSTILGDTAANLLEWLGHDVVRLNHVGDWGTQFGMLLEYMRRKEELSSQPDDKLQVGNLMDFYRKAKQEFDKDESFKKAAQTNVVALQAGEAWAREAWTAICEASRNEFDVVYQRLNIRNLKERGESFYNEMIPEVLEELNVKGLIREDNGAQCVFTQCSEAPLIVRKADGGYGYDSTDCAAVLQRLRDEKADRVIYVIDNGQEMHMRMVFEVAERAAWTQGRRLDFMGFGLVQGEDGKKFKTRSGDVVRLRDLLDEARDRAEVELKRRRGDEPATAEEQALLRANAERIGVAAVKYFDLRQNRNSDYRFSYDAMLDPKGNTAVYVLYAYARISAILRKASATVDAAGLASATFAEPAERALALRVLRLPEVLQQVEADLLPSRLVDYVYGLSVDFTAFYTACPVIGSDSEVSRLALCSVVQQTIKQCLDILGIEPLDQL